MAQKTAKRVSEKWGRNLAAAASDGSMEAAAQSVTESPGAAAVKKRDKLLAKLMKALEKGGKWERNTGNVSAQDWSSAFIKKGLPRIQTAATDDQPKVEQFMEQWLPFLYNVQAEVKRLPDTTEAERDARMVANAKKLRTFKRQKR